MRKKIRVNPKAILIVPVLGLVLLLLIVRPSKNTQPTFKKSLFSSTYSTSLPSVGINANLGVSKDGAIIKLSRENSTLSLNIPLAQAKLQKDKEELVYSVPEKVIETRYRLLENGLKEEIVLLKKPGNSKFTSELNVKNLVIKTTPAGIPVFYDSRTGEYQFHFERPFAKDAKGAVTYGVSYTLTPKTIPPLRQDFTKQAGKKKLLGELIPVPQEQNTIYILTTSVDPDWLHDPSRAYPITVDPTITHDTTGEFDDGTLNRVKDTGSPNLESYYHELPADIYTVGLWHMNNNWNDSSGNGNNGTASGATFTTSSRVGSHAGTFDGVDDRVYLATGSNVNVTGDITIEAWIYPTLATTGNIVHKDYQYSARIDTSGNFIWADSSNWSYANFGSINAGIVANQWQHLAVTKTGGVVRVYVNGVEKGSKVFGSNITPTNNVMHFGCYSGAGANSCSSSYFSGRIDEVRISNIARSPEEIKADAQRRPYGVYTSDVIDLTQNVVSWNSLSWTEVGVGTGDGEAPFDTSSLVAQWNFNEISGTTATNNAGSCGSACNGTLTNFTNTSGQDVVAGSGWTSANRRWGAGALMFDGSNDYVKVNDNNSLDITTDITLEAWVKTNLTTTGQKTILCKGREGNDTENYALLYYNNKLRLQWSTGATTWHNFDSANAVMMEPGWYHVAVAGTFGTTSSFHMYINGQEVPGVWTQGGTPPSANSQSLYIGRLGTYSDYWNGIIDSVRIYNRILSASEILANYNAGNIELQTRVGADASPDDGSWEEWRPVTSESQIASLDSDQGNWSWDSTATYMPKTKSDESIIKTEGSGSMRLGTGAPQPDTNTVGLWRLEENNCFSGYCFFDSSGSNNPAAPTGEVAIVDGFWGKARYFDGNNDYLNINDAASLQPVNITIEAWVKPHLVDSANHVIVNKQRGTSGPVGATYVLSLNSNNKFAMSSYYPDSTGWRNAVGTTTPTPYQWYHVAGTYDGTNLRLYVNGKLEATSALPSLSYLGTRPVKVGASEGATIDFGTFEYFVGAIDEIRISNVARSAEEIMEAYRAGRDHRISRTISSTDLSNRTKLPFWVASDRQGTFMEATIGESAYANYEPDANTVALWHLEENAGTGAYIKDSSSNGNHGTPTGTTSIQGKIGKARYFNNTSESININNNFTSLTNYTVSAWVKPAGNHKNYTGTIISSGDWNSTFWAFGLRQDNSGIDIGTADRGITTFPYNVPLNQWTFVTFTRNGTTIQVYANGQLIGSVTASGLVSNASNTMIGRETYAGGYFSFNGMIDEVRMENIARTPEEIRQAHEVGRRSHPITIDFKAKLDSANLISNSSDYSFTIDGTAYGAQNKGDYLYKGDKIIIKENIGGTEYLAQGTITSIDASTGAATVAAWDSGSTFPSGGFTANATVFKWQREYFDITGSLSTHRDAINRITFRITDGSQGANVWLDDIRSVSSYLTNPSPASNNITSSTGYRYFQYRAILSSNDTAVSPSLTSVTLDYETNSPPNTPTLNSPANGAANQSLTPALKTTATDNNNDYLRYKIQLCTDQAMTQNCQTFDQTASQTGWSGQNTQSNTAYTSGTQATYTPQTALNPGQTYYWRSYAIDPGGINLWSNTQASPYSFTTSAAPTAPTTPWCEGQSSPVTGVTDLTPEFSAVYTDTDVGDTANFYEIEVGTDDNWDSAEMWDSGKTAMTGVTAGNRSSDISYNGAALTMNGATYYWRIRFWDIAGNAGAWSDTQNFTMNNSPAAPTNLLCEQQTNPINVSDPTPEFSAQHNDPDGDAANFYQIQVSTSSNFTSTIWDSTKTSIASVGSGTTTPDIVYAGSPLSFTGTKYYWRIKFWDINGNEGAWSDTQNFTTASLVPPASCILIKNAENTQITVRWTDTNSIEDGYQIDKATDGVWSATPYYTTAADAIEYVDSTNVSSGHSYQYRIRAKFNAAYSDWCYTPTDNLGSGSFKFDGVKMEGLQIH